MWSPHHLTHQPTPRPAVVVIVTRGGPGSVFTGPGGATVSELELSMRCGKRVDDYRPSRGRSLNSWPTPIKRWPMTDNVFPTQLTERLWVKRWCGNCFEPDEAMRRLFDRGPGCSILAKALTGIMPVQFKRDKSVTDGALYFSCSRFRDKPAVYRRPRAKATRCAGGPVRRSTTARAGARRGRRLARLRLDRGRVMKPEICSCHHVDGDRPPGAA
jgi:hypothetical protein